MARSRSGSCHLTEIGTLTVRSLTLHDEFLAIVHFRAIRRDLLEIFEHVENVTTNCDSLRCFRIVTDGIEKRFTLHDIVTTSAS